MKALQIQQLLISKGYNLIADGVWGNKSKNALIDWQLKNGLIADGVAGAKTIASLQTEINTAIESAVCTDDDLASVALEDGVSKLVAKLPMEVKVELVEILKTRKLSKLQLCHFLAQVSHESANFKFKVENLNYSADGLRKIFGKYFNATTAAQCARQPERIANIVYANRMGNGNAASGDGFKFRGRGYIQLTGKDNYRAFDKTVKEDILANPDLVATKYPLTSALFFFDKNNLWSLMKDASTATQKTICKRVNGGTNGLADRIHHFNEYYA